MVYLTEQIIFDVCACDANFFGEDETGYYAVNKFQVTSMLVTLSTMPTGFFRECGYLYNANITETIVEHARKTGIVRLATRMSDCWENILAGRYMYDPVDTVHYVVDELCKAAMSAESNTEDTLFLMLSSWLNFAKRFVPSVSAKCAEDRKDKSLEGFLERNRKAEIFNSLTSTQPIVKKHMAEIKEIISQIFDEELRDQCYDALRHVFSFSDPLPNLDLPKNSTYEKDEAMIDKLMHVLDTLPNPLGIPCSTGLVEHKVFHQVDGKWFEPSNGLSYGYNDKNHGHQEYTVPGRWINMCRISAVEKNLDKYRIIGVEETYRTVVLGAITPMLTNYVAKKTNGEVDLSTTKNHENFCRIGAKTGKYSTVDSTAASDSIAYELVRNTFPDWFVEIVAIFRSNVCELGDTCYPLHLALLMGNRLTMVVQSVFYWAVAKLAYDYHKTWKVISRVPDGVFTYGDDVILASEITPLFIELMESFGFTINRSKTFVGKEATFTFNDRPYRYRESCGNEALFFYTRRKTAEWKRVSYPRKPIARNVEGLMRLVGLQHNLAETHRIFYDAADALGDLIKQTEPLITESEIGSIHQDVWRRCPALTYQSIPVKEGMNPEQVIKDELATLRPLGSEIHSRFRVKNKEIKRSRRIKEVAALYCYYRFLANGPLYANPLDELLHISTPLKIDDLINVKEGYELDRRG